MSTANSLKNKSNNTPSDNHQLSIRRSPGELDELYIQAFLKHPEAGKSAALRAAGYTGEYISQRAQLIHKRLAEQIDKELTVRMAQSTALGHNIIIDIATNSESDAIRLQAAKLLLDYGGKKPTDKLAVLDINRSIDDIDAEIAKVQRRILEAQGEIVNG